MNKVEKIKAEIERLKESLPWGSCASQISMECDCKDETYNEVLSYINTVEVKEVDIRSEISNWWNNHYTGAKKGYTFEGYSGHYMENSTIISLAQYFFELGLNAKPVVIYKPQFQNLASELGLKTQNGE